MFVGGPLKSEDLTVSIELNMSSLRTVPKKWLDKLDRTIAAEIRRQVPDLLAIAAGPAPAGGRASALPGEAAEIDGKPKPTGRCSG